MTIVWLGICEAYCRVLAIVVRPPFLVATFTSPGVQVATASTPTVVSAPVVFPLDTIFLFSVYPVIYLFGASRKSLAAIRLMAATSYVVSSGFTRIPLSPAHFKR